MPSRSKHTHARTHAHAQTHTARPRHAARRPPFSLLLLGGSFCYARCSCVLGRVGGGGGGGVSLITVIHEPVRSGDHSHLEETVPTCSGPPSGVGEEFIPLPQSRSSLDTVLKEWMGHDQPQLSPRRVTSLLPRHKLLHICSPTSPHSVLHTGTDKSGCQQVS